MNERIRLLAEQAGLTWRIQPLHYTNTNNPIDFPVSANRDLEKFAELIIEQCAELVDRAWDPTGEQLKRHFGMAPPMGYNEEELDRDNPYNQWMNHAQ